MLNWLFKKRASVGAPSDPTPTAGSAQPPRNRPAISASAEEAKAIDGTAAEWPEQLRAAQGDDAALLRIAKFAPVLEIKFAAVEALASEGALRQAEREFRSHDRKVHLVAKQRLNTAVARREAHARARTLLERAAALRNEALVPINHVVALDRDWEALPLDLLEPGLCVQFAELRARLDAAMHERGDEQRRLQRWTAAAKQSVLDWPRAIAAAADLGTTGDIAVLRQSVESLRQTRPDVPATAELDRALVQALQCAVLVEIRLAWFEALSAQAADPTRASVAGAHDERPDPQGTDGNAAAAAQAPGDSPALIHAQRWNDLPAMPDGELTLVLNRRHERWLCASQPARPAVAVSAAAATKPPRAANADLAFAQRRLRLEARLQQAEAALADGQFGKTKQHLQAIAVAVSAMNAATLPDTLRARHQAVQAEFSRLRGWQQWGGGRARDDLIAEAEQLAQRTLAAADPGAQDGPKLNLKDHAESIRTLRMRWKELDRLGAAAGPDPWQRFDVALNTAFQPVAVQHAALKAARHDNLVAREALLDQLQAMPVPEASADAVEGAVDWRKVSSELDRFQLAWRKLGPIAHTVPSDAHEALQQRLRMGLERIETPLQEARRAASDVREKWVALAETLASEVGHRLPLSDATRQVRELQLAWQGHARRLPLPRALESALWARFKVATDAVFARRDADLAARDAELAANLATRELLLQRLSALGSDTAVADIERTLSDVDRTWRQAVDLPRGASEIIEGRFRSVRAAASQFLTANARTRWQAQCDTLVAKLALCDEREGANANSAELNKQWAAQDALPAMWEQALALRWSRTVEPGPLPQAAVDDLLLELEAALELPTAPEWQAARRNLKLRALKDALERGGSPKNGPVQRSEWLIATLRQSGLTPAQAERLRAVVAALRRAPPEVLDPSTTAD